MARKILAETVKILKRNENTFVYLDAGNSNWNSPDIIVQRLNVSCISLADGFSINVSHFVETEEVIKYGEKISEQTGAAHFIIDTSRNGKAHPSPEKWCNPDGCRLGYPPTLNVEHPLIDAFLWIKPPGESDGLENSGLKAEKWWAEGALKLAKNSSF